MSLQALSHGTLELAKPLNQPSRFIGKETETQRGEVTSLRWRMSQGRAGAGTLAANSQPGAFPLLKTTGPALAPLPPRGRILGSSGDL